MRTELLQGQTQHSRTRNRQLEFLGRGFFKPKDEFGGSLLKNSNAKSKRPLDSKWPIHLVLHSKLGGMRLPKNFHRVNQAAGDIARKHGVRIYKYSNVGNHLHMVIKIPRSQAWAAFIRELSGRIAQLVQGLSGQEKGRKFWSQRPFTRLIRSWREGFRNLKNYVTLNELEANGHISRVETRSLKDLRLIFAVG